MRRMNMEQVEVWLEAIPSKQTKKSYRTALRKFENWYKKPIQSLIGNPEEATKAVERFFCYLKGDYCQNTARSTTNGVLQYFARYPCFT
jgi:site-specific recombinase XerD